jgi:hypothetical protein
MTSPGLAPHILPFPLTLAATDPMQWIIYAMIALAVSYIVLRPMMRKRKDPMEKPPNFSLAEQRAVERQMSDLLVELSEMARKVSAQLDTRSRKLELLIHDADEKIAELKRLTEEQAMPPRLERRAREPEGPPPTGAGKDEAMIDARYSAIYDLADQGRSPQEIAHELDRPQGEVELILALRR